MLVKVKPGLTVYREGYIRNQKSGVCRLFDTPPSKTEPHNPDDPEGPTKFDAWFGHSLELPTEHEAQEFENDPTRNLSYRDSLHSTNVEETMGRGAAIGMALSQLDHNDDSQ